MMNISAHSGPVSKWKQPRALIIRTTLYDLIAAINAVVGANEEDLVVASVVQLVQAQRLTSLGPSLRRRLVTAHRRALQRRHPKAATTARRGRLTLRAPRPLRPRPGPSARSLPSRRHRRPPGKA